MYPPASLSGASEAVKTFDWTGHVPGFDDEPFRSTEEILQIVRGAAAEPRLLDVVIDSADALLADLGSLSRTTSFLSELLAVIRARNGPSRLILHVLSPSPLLPVLTQTRFSPSLVHVNAHPTALLTHLASAYLTPPPPLSSPEKFWRVFIPVAERHYESEKLVFGQGGEGSGGGSSCSRCSSVVRTGRGDGGAWTAPWRAGRMDRPAVESQGAPDPTQNLSFNLNLTPEQQRSRAQVPLPYAHEGKPAEQIPSSTIPAAILYDPDSADDIDDDDPDEDLDI
ncbi:hypothetical protein A0H81_00750 [Grifola frondosa]|uniref:Elongator complex protein 5 n=1 Tax=Grifola frondosa TaxID=5627 RepID=A0A1C7MR66_GRIFR|nr:hypothetical protein A0H81_00750 [Grifola frondosa]